jgi:hypothetical protein
MPPECTRDDAERLRGSPRRQLVELLGESGKPGLDFVAHRADLQRP